MDAKFAAELAAGTRSAAPPPDDDPDLAPALKEIEAAARAGRRSADVGSPRAAARDRVAAELRRRGFTVARVAGSADLNVHW